MDCTLFRTNDCIAVFYRINVGTLLKPASLETSVIQLKVILCPENPGIWRPLELFLRYNNT